MNAAAAYLRFEVRRALRNKQYFTMTVALPTVFYLVFSRTDASRSPQDGADVAVYLLGSMAVFGALSASLFGAVNLSVERTSGWGEQLRTTPLPAPAYVAVKVLTRLALVIPAVALVAAAGALVNRVELNTLQLLGLLAAVVVGALPFVTLGIAIGARWEPESAQAAATSAYVLLSLLGGLWMPVDRLPGVVGAIGRTLPSHHLAELARNAVGGHPPSLASLAALAAWTALTALAAARSYRRSESAKA